MTASEIARLIETGIPGARVQVRGDDGRHFEALVVAEAFAGLSPVQQHRLVYQALGERMRDDSVHALSLRTMTPAQWAAAQGADEGA